MNTINTMEVDNIYQKCIHSCDCRHSLRFLSLCFLETERLRLFSKHFIKSVDDYRKMVQDNWGIDRINYTQQYNKPLYFYEWLYKNLTSEELKLVSRELFKCECCRIHSYILSDKNKTSEMLDFKQWVDG